MAAAPAALLGLLRLLRGLASLYFAAGILGSLAPAALALPDLAAATVYGRLLAPPARGGSTLATLLAPALACTLPKSTAFTLFYALGSAAALAALAAARAAALPPAALALQAAFAAHTLRRLYECLRVHAFSPAARMPLHLVAFGAAHYAAAPLALLALPPCGAGGAGAAAPAAAAATLAALAGGTLALAGSALQAAAHAALARMPRAAPPRPAYPLPTAARHGWPFALALCPHYTAEVAIYCGLLLWRAGLLAGAQDAQEGCSGSGSVSGSAWDALGGALGALGGAAPALMLAWVVCNLGVTGGRLKAWYAAAYPGCGVEARAAVFPGLY
jgi:hypothetical protein